MKLCMNGEDALYMLVSRKRVSFIMIFIQTSAVHTLHIHLLAPYWY